MKRIIKTLSICLGILFLFVVGCKKKGETTTTNKTTNQTTTTKTTSNESTTKKTTTNKTTTRKTTTQATTTVDDKRTTLIDLFDRDGDYISASISYVENGETKVATEDTYIEDGTPIDITISFIGDYAINISDGDSVTTNYLIYSGELIFIGEHDDPEPETFTISNYVPQTQKVEITYRSLDSYTIDYDRLVYDVVMRFNGTDYSSSTRRSIVEGDKANVTIKNNNSDKRILFEIYEYDDNEEPTKLVEEHIIGKSGSYTMDEFQVFKDYYFKVTEYVAYTVTFNDMATSDNITYDFKAILDGAEKTVVSGEEYLDGSKIKAVITNNSNKDMVFKITDESNHKVFITTIKTNSTYTTSESEYITLDKNILLYSELIDYLNVNLKSNVEGVTYVITDIEGIGYNFGPVRAGYLRINVTNNTSSSIMTSAYDDDDNGLQLSIVRAGETGYIFVQHFDMNVNIYTEECPDDKKFYIDCGFYASIFKVYDRNNNELSFDDGFSLGKSVTLYIDMAVMTDTSIYAYDFTNKLIAGGTIYANSSNTKLYLSFNIESDVKVYVEQKSDNEIIKVDISFNMMNTSVTISDENGVILAPFNNFAIVTKGTKLTVTVFDPNDNFKIYSYYYDENDQRVDVIPETRVNKNQEKTFNFTINHDIEIRYMFV